ncbi:substrate-binding domain-containing protein [Candidatus Entotheonella palauensis]|uniref:substrate-binding domain-containing protein n=1 Tax=Candidatus Entotheonella palauensis TaxID=93172 RepID=UPI000B7DDF12|nr:substrate-binding domain-containing protein [Candidatus Entotheonella palauensis]
MLYIKLGFVIGVCLLLTVLQSLVQPWITHAQRAAANPAMSRPQPDEILPEMDPLEVEGDIVMMGSETLFPLTETLYEHFVEAGYAGTIRLMKIGTSAGFQLFCEQGTADVVIATRRINIPERLACLQRDRHIVELRLGTDALVVVVNPDNDLVRKASLAQLEAIFTAEKWSDVNADWPEEKIIRFVPDPNSVAFRYFTIRIFGTLPSPLLHAPNTTLSSDHEELTTGLSVNQYAVGFLDYAHYQQQALLLKALSVDGVEPDEQSVKTRQYPLLRPLFISSSPTIIRSKPQVRAFLTSSVNHVSDVIGEVGLFAVSQDIMDETKQHLKRAAYPSLTLKTP